MVTAEEKHQVICSKCRFKFACRNRNACPRCQTPMEKMKAPLFLHYTYYHCTKKRNPSCTQKCLSGKELDQQIDSYLARIQISERFKDWAIKYLHELHEKESTSRNDIIQAQQNAYRACLGQIDNLVKLKTSSSNSDGSLLSDEEYGKQRLLLLKEKAGLEELLRDAGHRVLQWLKLSEETFEFACAARERFSKGDPKTKKEILLAIGSNLTLKDKKLCIEARKPFFILENSLSSNERENSTLEPETIRSPKRQKEAIASSCPRVLADLEDVRTLQHNNEYVVKAIYHFFRSICMSPSFSLSDWFMLYHSGSMDDSKN